ncbi:MAG TPA: hypothetical protein VJY65_04905 [Chloroflexota bacterium]|nr:hypothetical protein [Chloroflexota bacterium]
MYKRLMVWVVILALLGAALAQRGLADQGHAQQPLPMPGMASMPGMSGQSMASMPGMDSHTGVRVNGHVSYVSVGLDENGIVMTSVTHAGPTTFHVLNIGERAHRVRIEGPGVSKQLLLQASEKASWTVTLRAGTYRVAYTDAAHVARGLVLKLRATP